MTVDLCGSKSSTYDERVNLESCTLSIKGNAEFDQDDLVDQFPEAVAIRFPKNMDNIAYVQFETIEKAKNIKEEGVQIAGVQTSLEFVPDRASGKKNRVKGDKWEKKKQAKREQNNQDNGKILYYILYIYTIN